MFPTPVESDLDLDERILGPVTAFNEIAEPEIAGECRWHSVSFGAYFHRFVRLPAASDNELEDSPGKRSSATTAI